MCVSGGGGGGGGGGAIYMKQQSNAKKKVIPVFQTMLQSIVPHTQPVLMQSQVRAASKKGVCIFLNPADPSCG